MKEEIYLQVQLHILAIHQEAIMGPQNGIPSTEPCDRKTHETHLSPALD